MNQVVQAPSEEEVQIKASISELVAASKDVVILSHADLSMAVDLCKTIKERLNESEKMRTDITQPINKGLREINRRFKAMQEPLTEAENLIKSRMIKFQEAEERRAREEAARKEKKRQEQLRLEREAEERRRAEEAEQADDPTLDRAPAPEPVQEPERELQPIQPQVRKTTYGQSGASFTAKKVWTFEMEDISKVPPQFLSLDETKVNQAIRAGLRDIPGLRIFEKSVASIR